MNVLVLLLIVFFVCISIPMAIAQIKIDSSVKDTLTPTDNRKSFGYCPIDTDTQTVLTKYGVTFEIESCPIARIYIDNWDRLDDASQQAIVDELQQKGYRIEKD